MLRPYESEIGKVQALGFDRRAEEDLAQRGLVSPWADDANQTADEGDMVFLTTAALVFNSMLPAQAGSWVCVTDKAAFSPRDTAEDVVFRGRMWLSNGYYYGNVLTRDLWSSSDGANWTVVTSETPYDGYSEMVVYQGKVWAVKGSVWCSGDGATWTQVCAQTPFGSRSYGEVVVHDGKLWQLGSGADVWYSTDGKNWACAARQAPYEARFACAVAVFKGRIWVMGGASEAGNTPPEKHYPQFTTRNDVWCSPDGAHWERVLEHAPWSPRMWFVSKVYAGRMWIIGGFDNVNGANLGDVWYTEDGASWHQFTSPGASFSPRHEPTCYVYDRSLWVVAGNSWPLRNDAWRLTLPAAARAEAGAASSYAFSRRRVMKGSSGGQHGAHPEPAMKALTYERLRARL